MKKIFNFILGWLLFILAYTLFFPLSITNYFIVLFKSKDNAKGYFINSAVNLDKYANRELRTLWNSTLRTRNGYEFGDYRETISSVIGKNKRDGTLSKFGKVLATILDFLDKNHCIKSIFEFKEEK